MATLRIITRAETEAWKELMNDKNFKDEIEARKVEPVSQDSLLTALYKYIPATVIVLYTFLDTLFTSMTEPPVKQWLGLFFFMLVAAFVLTYLIAKNPDLPKSVRKKQNKNEQIKNLVSIIDGQKLKQAVVAVIAFAGYVVAIGGPFTYIKSCGEGNAQLAVNVTNEANFCLQRMPAFEWQPYYGAVGLVLATLVVAILVQKDILAT